MAARKSMTTIGLRSTSSIKDTSITCKTGPIRRACSSLTSPLITCHLTWWVILNYTPRESNCISASRIANHMHRMQILLWLMFQKPSRWVFPLSINFSNSLVQLTFRTKRSSHQKLELLSKTLLHTHNQCQNC